MDPIRYTLRFPSPHTHYVEVRAEVPTSGRDEVELMMAVWTPGSYLIREYERHVENVAATGTNGAALAVHKTAKNRWTISTDGADTIIVTYRVYGREMSVRTNWIESAFALINGAPTFLTLTDSNARPYEVTLTLPPRGAGRQSHCPRLPVRLTSIAPRVTTCWSTRATSR
jgi:predicted metalloprotease with PDZ domain